MRCSSYVKVNKSEKPKEQRKETRWFDGSNEHRWTYFNATVATDAEDWLPGKPVTVAALEETASSSIG